MGNRWIDAGYDDLIVKFAHKHTLQQPFSEEFLGNGHIQTMDVSQWLFKGQPSNNRIFNNLKACLNIAEEDNILFVLVYQTRVVACATLL